MADILTQNGLSTGPLNAPDTSGYTAPLQTGSRPIDLIQARQQTIQNLGIMQYPQDLPKYYMQFNIQKFTRESLMAIGQSESLYNIALPLPDRMLDVNQVQFDKKAFSATIGNALDSGLSGAGGSQNLGSAATDFLQAKVGTDPGGLISGALSGAGKGLAIDAGSALTGGQGVAAAGALGYSPNYFLTVILDGPQYKQHSFSWTMSPRNPSEARDLTRIIRVFKNCQAPGLVASLGNAIFSFPRVFRIFYGPDREHLYQFKPAVLMNFAVDYTGGGAPAMRRPDQITDNKSPAAVYKIQAQFMELEFWLRSDYGDNSTGNDPNADLAFPVPGSGRSDP